MNGDGESTQARTVRLRPAPAALKGIETTGVNAPSWESTGRGKSTLAWPTVGECRTRQTVRRFHIASSTIELTIVCIHRIWSPSRVVMRQEIAESGGDEVPFRNRHDARRPPPCR
jgi:hypothetical protein